MATIFLVCRHSVVQIVCVLIQTGRRLLSFLTVDKMVAMQLPKLPPDVVQYFTNPESMEPPDFQVLVPLIDSALPLAYGVFGVQLFHVWTTLGSFLHFSS